MIDCTAASYEQNLSVPGATTDSLFLLPIADRFEMSVLLQKAIKKYVHTPGPRNEIDEILEPYLLMQRFFGLQIIDPQWTWKKYGIYRIPSIILGLYITAGTIEVIGKTKDLNLMIEGILTLLVNVQMATKIFLFISQRDQMRENYFIAKTYIFDLVKKTPHKRDQILSRVKLAARFFLLASFLMVFMYSLICAWNALYNGIRQPLSRSTSTLMPMTSPYFELGCVIQVFYLTEVCISLMFIDVWYAFCCLFFIVAADFSVDTLEADRDKFSDTYPKELDSSLKRFYVVHAEMMEFLNRLNGTFKWVCLVPITVLLVQISLFLMMIQKEINFQVAVVMFPANGQIFFWNFFGELISSRGEKVNMALINFDWTSMKISDQKKYYIITSYLNKRVAVITALGNDLSMLTLSSIYKMIYQMFTVVNATV